MKGRVFFVIILGVSLFSGQLAFGEYCSASGQCSDSIPGSLNIDSVEVGDISNTGTGCDGYSDYTSLSTTMEIGQGYGITVTNGDPYDSGDQCGIWVDWNQDEDFEDAGETIPVSGGNVIFTATITPPEGAALGDTRMRIRIRWVGTLSPCGSTTYGEVEDYTITVASSGPSTVSISGCVKTAEGVRIKGAIVSASTGPNTVTNALGEYTLILPSPFSGSIQPAQLDWTFGARLYIGQTTDLENEDFTGTYNVFYGGGSGTSLSPYLINTAAQLNAIGARAFDWGKYFRLGANIDLSDYDGLDGRPSFNRIGCYINNGVDHMPFTGVFDGSGGTISNFTFDSNCGIDGVGLFGYVNASGAQIKNVKLTNVDVNSTSSIGTGSLIGYMFEGTVNGCSVQTGAVSGRHDIGGLVGMSWKGTISNCDVAGVYVSGELWAGGLLGSTGTGGTIEDCNASCTVTGEQECGGLIGSVGTDVISVTRCSSGGSVTVTDRSAGGLVGVNGGTIDSCFSMADATGIGANEIGGLVGRNLEIISNSYAMGSASGSYDTGGLAGLNWQTPSTAGTITNCYSMGTSTHGGLIGYNLNGVVTSSFWDTETSGRTWSDGGTGKTTAEMQTEATFTSAGWDFIGETANGEEDIWYIEPGDYPRFCWQGGIKYGGGSGEADNPYLIYTAEQMNQIGTDPNDWNKNFKLMADIDLSAYSGSSYNIIGTSPPTSGSRTPFRGVFDGNFHSISGFSYSRYSKNYVGLFGYIYYSTIKNLTVVSPNITDPGYNDMRYVGALAGYSSNSDVSGCSVVGGTVEGEEYVGGLIGVSIGFIAECSSTASVWGVDYIGGLVGAGTSTFGGSGRTKDSYAQGTVSGNNYIGGFAGSSSDMTIVNCYSIGPVSGANNVGGFSGYNVNTFPISDNVIGCFWDVESSGEPNSATATGLPTAEMQDPNTFLDTGWDFVGEVNNGGSDDWAMPAGGGYPVLWYELPVAPNLPSFAGGSGTIGDPYLIETEEQLNGIGHNPRLMDKHFKLISDLNMEGINYYMVANRPYVFSGTFDGAGHTISNISLEHTTLDLSYIGFIGSLYGNEASVENLTLAEPNITSTWGWGVGSLVGINESGTISNCRAVNVHVVGMLSVGGLVGVNYWYSSISNCSATGEVLEDSLLSVIFSGVGGLVGENSYWSEIDNSYAKCDVSGDDCVGGLVGMSLIYNTITNCYSQGNVTGTEDYIGGLIGRNLGHTETDYCYSVAEVNGPAGTDAVGGFVGKMGTSEYYAACFWDNEVNPDMNGIGNWSDVNVIGESTENMQTGITFTDAGWDFVGEVINGPNDIWDICDGMNYPKLSWQILPGDFICPDGVDFIDFAVLADTWLLEVGAPGYNPICDISEPADEIIDMLDLEEFTENWLMGK